MKVLDFLCSEAGYLVAQQGILGEDYTMANNIPVPKDMARFTSRISWIEPQYGTLSKPYCKPEETMKYLETAIQTFNSAYHDQIRKEATFLSEIKYFPPTIAAPTPVSDKNSGVLRDIWNELSVRLVYSTAPANFERAFDEALAEYKSLGGDEVAEEAQKLYAAERR